MHNSARRGASAARRTTIPSASRCCLCSTAFTAGSTMPAKPRGRHRAASWSWRNWNERPGAGRRGRGLRSRRGHPRRTATKGNGERMNLDGLLPNLGEWLLRAPARNRTWSSPRGSASPATSPTYLPFSTRASPAQKAEIETRARDAVRKPPPRSPATSAISASTACRALDRQFLVERQLISRELSTVLEGPRGVAFDDRESTRHHGERRRSPADCQRDAQRPRPRRSLGRRSTRSMMLSKPSSATPSTISSATSPPAPPTSAPACGPA